MALFILTPHTIITNRVVVKLEKHPFFLVDLQDEQYDHLDEADVTKVDKLTSEVMMWMNSSMNQQSKQSLSVDPSIKVKDIQAKTKVSRCLSKHSALEHS